MLQEWTTRMGECKLYVCNGRASCDGSLMRCTHTRKAEELREALARSVALEKARAAWIAGRIVVHPRYGGSQ